MIMWLRRSLYLHKLQKSFKNKIQGKLTSAQFTLGPFFNTYWFFCHLSYYKLWIHSARNKIRTAWSFRLLQLEQQEYTHVFIVIKLMPLNCAILLMETRAIKRNFLLWVQGPTSRKQLRTNICHVYDANNNMLADSDVLGTKGGGSNFPFGGIFPFLRVSGNYKICQKGGHGCWKFKRHKRGFFSCHHYRCCWADWE